MKFPLNRKTLIGHGNELKATCSIATILMNGPILESNIFEFIFVDSLNHRFSYIIQHQMLFCKLQTSCWGFMFQPGHLLAPEQLCETLDESLRHAFSKLAKALQQFLCRKPCVVEIQEISFVSLCCCYCYVTRRQQATICITSIFTAKQAHLWYAWLILLRKCFRCEVKFS